MSEPLLLVDDDPVFVDILSRSLTRNGYNVYSANTAQQALELGEQHIFKAAIIDLKLESSSGLALIPALLKLQSKLHILMLTGYSSIATAVDAIKLGAANYLCKPAGIEEILLALKSESSSDTSSTLTPQNVTRPSVERLEWEHIQKTLQQHDGNISATARALNMHRRTLQRKLQKKPVQQ